MTIEAEVCPSTLEFDLLNRFQKDFPIIARPYAAVAAQIGCDEQAVLDTLQDLQERGMVSRVGAVFRPNVIGSSALAALAVPAARLEPVAAYVSARAEVNHNYQREHRYNLWFVVAADSAARLEDSLLEIEQACACGTMLVLPMVEEYHINLGFDLHADGRSNGYYGHLPGAAASGACSPVRLEPVQRQLVACLERGLPLVPRPFAHWPMPERDAIRTLADWTRDGVIKRFGVVVRHHELGFSANAMVVIDVPDLRVAALGREIAASGLVTLCYRRRRQLPQWRYNLFCMVHGRSRDMVEQRIAELAARFSLPDHALDVLFSCRRFKQRGAHYIHREASDGRN